MNLIMIFAHLEKNLGVAIKRDLAKGTSDYTHQHPLPAAAADAILPVFESLSDHQLLTRCLHGGTQNQNESLNSLILQRATKETHSGLAVVQLPTALADGAETFLIFFWKNLELTQETIVLQHA